MSYRFVLIIDPFIDPEKMGEPLDKLIKDLYKKNPRVEVFLTSDPSGKTLCYALSRVGNYATAAKAISTRMIPNKTNQLLVLGSSVENLIMTGTSPAIKANTKFSPEVKGLDQIMRALQEILEPPAVIVAAPVTDNPATPLVSPRSPSGWRKWFCCCGSKTESDSSVPVIN